MAYVVSLKQYEYSGPLDLLLDMISHAKINIREIFISEITEQYLETMKQIGDLDMDSASEFLQMAATLLEIKSRALLPRKEPEAEEEQQESPEEALFRQLEEYKRFKELSEQLRGLEESASDCYTKLPEEYPLPPAVIELKGLTVKSITRAFARVMKRLEAQANTEQFERFSRREVRRDSYTVLACMAKILEKTENGAVSFFSLFEDSTEKEEVITVFLALLELLKLNRVCATQETEYADIQISRQTGTEFVPLNEEEITSERGAEVAIQQKIAYHLLDEAPSE